MGSGEVSRGEKMALRGADPESYMNEYTLVHEDKCSRKVVIAGAVRDAAAPLIARLPPRPPHLPPVRYFSNQKREFFIDNSLV